CSISAMEALRRVAQFAAEKGIYVIFGGYSVRSYWSGADQDALPFPPYQKSVNASEIIASKEEFAEWWGMLAREFKNYPNVIFELWNEPHNTATANKTNDEAFADWVNATQQCINAIRAAGFTGLIIHNWA
ncbi:MAG: cellulase family glycosylhydrolase, partial [Candidatus Bathyarchaeia archaeon]